MEAQPKVVLHHLEVSHYNEKARWALDYKHVPHKKRAGLVGAHAKVAKKLTGGTTFPVLVIDGEAIGDSTRIIEMLERRWPDPPLYPTDPGAREHALALEDFFDEEFGPYVRALVIWHMLPSAKLTLGAFVPSASRPRYLVARAMWPMIKRQFVTQLELDEAAIDTAFQKVHAAGERVRAELGPGGYLVGGRFTVADLTLAALCSPAVAPPEFPYPQPQRGHPLLAPVRDALREAGLYDWALEMYGRHRVAISSGTWLQRPQATSGATPRAQSPSATK